MRLPFLPLAILALLIVAACSSSAGLSGTSGSEDSSSEATSSFSAAAMSSAPAGQVWDGKMLTGKHTAMLKTSKGDVTIELDADVAPKTVTNFVALAKSGYYNGLTFHRVIPGFMIQGGDPNGNGTGGSSIYGDTFEDEIMASSPLYQVGYKAGVVAMANRGPNTNGSQFFIMDKDYPLPPLYTIFGHVTGGQEVVNAIARVQSNPSNNMPLEPVTFEVEVR